MHQIQLPCNTLCRNPSTNSPILLSWVTFGLIWHMCDLSVLCPLNFFFVFPFLVLFFFRGLSFSYIKSSAFRKTAPTSPVHALDENLFPVHSKCTAFSLSLIISQSLLTVACNALQYNALQYFPSFSDLSDLSHMTTLSLHHIIFKHYIDQEGYTGQDRKMSSKMMVIWKNCAVWGFLFSF